MTTTSHVAIIGGGAMGCATAYYLAKAGISSTIIESEGIATQASAPPSSRSTASWTR